jgi:hypothetical protein
MSTIPNVQKMTEEAESAFNAAHRIVESMSDGSRKQIKELTMEVAAVLGKDAKKVSGFVNHFVHETDIAYVTRGKNGGLIKGTRPAKIVKPKKAKKEDDTQTNQ